MVAVVVPKWLGSQNEDEATTSVGGHDSDSDVDVDDVDMNNNHGVEGITNRCPECLAREAAEVEAGVNNKVGSESQ